MKLAIDRIRRDGGTQPRSTLSSDETQDYAELMRGGIEFPPITVFFDGHEYWLADGFHRVSAWLQVWPHEPIEADVIQGTLSDAQWYSYGVNKSHGIHRSREDRIRAVKAALRHPQGAGRSDSDIAEHVGVSHPTVAKYRAELEQQSTCKIFKSTGQTGEADAAVPQPQQSASVEQPSAPPQTPRPRKGRDGRTINTAQIGKGNSKRTSPRNVKISPKAILPKLGHSAPNPMIPLQFSPRNAHTAAATLIREFPREWVEQLVQDLNNFLSQQGAVA